MKMVLFTLTLVRHGETVANRRRIIQGQQDIPLSDTGEEQARLVGSRLRDESFTHVYASDLRRAAKTAEVIMEKNCIRRCEIVYDTRLRERKFGNVEGRSYKELVAAAKKSNTPPADYCPNGSENIKQLRDRAVAFFHELCAKLRTCSPAEEMDYVPGSIKRRITSEGGQISHQEPQHAWVTPHNYGPCAPMNKVVNASGRMEDDVDQSKAKRPRHGSGDMESDNGNSSQPLSSTKMESDNGNSGQPLNSTKMDSDNAESSQLHSGTQMDSDNGASNQQHSGTQMDSDNAEKSQRQSSTQMDSAQSVIARSNSSSSSGYASLPEIQEGEVELSPQNHEPSRGGSCSRESTPCDIDSLFHPTVASDTEIKSQVSAAKSRDVLRGDCPNVSLSPLFEHRLPSISSISSGRNSSFDDGDGLALSVADVLLVSHGGFLKELIRHFIEDLGCKVPGGKDHALRVSPNTGVSKFTVTTEDDNSRPVITCLGIHDKDHLHNMVSVVLPRDEC